MRTHRRFAAVIVASTLVLGACAGGSRPTVTEARPDADAPSEPTSTTVDPHRSLVAEARATIDVYALPGAPEPAQALDHPTENGGPLVFLVKQEDPDFPEWLEVHLPVRPNGSTGWIRRADVDLTQHRFRVVVERDAHQITVYNGEEVVLQEPVAIGTRDTPTPGGVFYIKELLEPPDKTTVYGPFAYGLSGFSNVYTSFAGGEGVIGIHGNNDPSVLGSDVSAGCVRMSNDGITELTDVLPLGTPVEIQA